MTLDPEPRARILILGTGLIGSSVGLALHSPEVAFRGTVLGWDASPVELATALEMGALDEVLPDRESCIAAGLADIYVLATPVLPVLDWMRHLSPVLGPEQLVTDVGSTKLAVCGLAETLFNGTGQARFLPGHPMAGKESGGAALAEAGLFRGAAWLFTSEDPRNPGQPLHPLELRWRALVQRFGATMLDLAPERHDELCAWVSHLPQMLSTALAALLQDTFAGDPAGRAALQAMGGRALRETTRLGSSPYSMWRDVALTNTEAIAATLQELEQRLAHLRENLRTPELRAEFGRAKQFRHETFRG